MSPVFLPCIILKTPYSRKTQSPQISFDQKFGKPDLMQMRREQHGCEELQWPFFKNNSGNTQNCRNLLTNPTSENKMHSFCVEEQKGLTYHL